MKNVFIALGHKYPRFQLYLKQGHNSRTEKKVVKSEIKFGLPIMVPGLVCKFHLICLRGT